MGNLDTLFRPRSVAVVGASNSEGKIGHTIFRNLVDSGFKGGIYAVNPRDEVVLGRPSYPTIGEVPEPVDVAAVAIPVGQVLETVLGRKMSAH